MAKLTLLDQMTKGQIETVARMVGADFAGPTFRNFLREVPALDPGFTPADAVLAYLEARTMAIRYALAALD